MDAKDAKKDANSKHQINTSEFSISEKYFCNAPTNGNIFRQFYI